MIEFDRITAGYDTPGGGHHTVVEDLSLTIKRGELVYLIGPTGSGKSTLLKLLYMDKKPEEGAIRVGDYDSDSIRPRDIPFLRRSLGVVFQDFQLLGDRTASDNVAFALYATGKRGKLVKQRVTQVLTRVGVSHRAKAMPHELSGGEQQRVCIARAIANEPYILLADEPTGNLDPKVGEEIQKLLLRLHQQGMTVFMATHDYRLIKKYPARTLALTQKRLVEVDPATLGG
ncbi:MAG: ATP-binding cassette domain-containing protein [Bacteroidota bacterium]